MPCAPDLVGHAVAEEEPDEEDRRSPEPNCTRDQGDEPPTPSSRGGPPNAEGRRHRQRDPSGKTMSTHASSQPGQSPL